MDGGSRQDSISQLVEDDFKIKGAASRPHSQSTVKESTALEACTICLESITERAVAAPCNHLSFDFLCLVSWLQERATCPLCNAAVEEVQYDWRSPVDYKTYHVPETKPVELRTRGAPVRPTNRQRPHRQRIERRTPSADETVTEPSLERRKLVYRNRLYSLHVGANERSRYRNFTAEAFASSNELQSRARSFLRREVRVFNLQCGTRSRAVNEHYLIEYIVAILRNNELKSASGHAEDLIAEFVGRDNARLLLHELEAWLRSPYLRLDDWDRHVQYAGMSNSKA